ncbi:MAG: hypothetical protein Q9221_007250 [Calogaya cf. arnoldii]
MARLLIRRAAPYSIRITKAGPTKTRAAAAEVKNPPPGKGGDKNKTPMDQKEMNKLRQAPKYEKGYNFVLNEHPDLGVTGYLHDKAKKVVEIFYGDDAPRHGINVAWNNLANSHDVNQPITLHRASSEEHAENRKNALRYLKKNPAYVLDEKPIASVSHEDWWGSIVKVSPEESKITFHDNRSKATKEAMDKEIGTGELQLYRGPKVDGMPTPKHVTADFSSGSSKRRKKNPKENAKRGVLESMKDQEHSQQDPSSEYREEIGRLLDAYDVVQKNTTDLIWPFIEDMLAASHSSLVYEAAFAVYAHLTMAPVAISGPFAYGMHGFDEYEDRLVESGASNETMTMVYAIDGILIDLYQAAWQKATATLDATELRDDFDFLADYLDPKDRSLLPGSFVNVDSAGDDRYDVFLPPVNGFTNTIIVNGTLADVEEAQPNVG